MSDSEQIAAFEAALDALVTRFIAEYDLSTAAAIGVLQLKAHKIMVHACSEDDDGD